MGAAPDSPSPALPSGGEPGPYQAAAAAAVASLGAAAESLNASAANAAEWRRFLAEAVTFSRDRLALLHQEDLSRLASLIAERGQRVDACLAELARLSETVDQRRVASRDSKPRTSALAAIGELESATRHRLSKERQAACQRLSRIRRLLEAKVLP